jgi:hypothetical protein
MLLPEADGDDLMRKAFLLCLFLLLNTKLAMAVESGTVAAEAAEYVQINVDRVVVDTVGLETASTKLAGSVDRLALAIGQLSADDVDLSDADRQILLDAVVSVDAASAALAELARQLPQTAQGLSDRLPRIIADARAPLAEMSASLQAARDSVAMITESLPLATENARILVNSALDSALQRLIFYSIALVAIVALALIGIMWFIYRQYLAPLTRKLDELAGAPEHFENMSRHMRDTSANLLLTQKAASRLQAGPGGHAAYQRRQRQGY